MKKKQRSKEEEDFWKDIKKHIDEGHRRFWKKRGLSEPPSTSYNKTFTYGTKTGRKSQWS